MSDLGLQDDKLGSSTKKTLWQLCQLAVTDRPGESKEQARSGVCTLHNGK